LKKETIQSKRAQDPAEEAYKSLRRDFSARPAYLGR
jgi:hypothetical protein